jgi:predicted AlkP superfamily phosphohydrolase/phosphomutase
MLAIAAVALFGAWGRAQAQPAEHVVVLGFDGADPDTIERMIAEGELPHLARLAREGTFAPLATTRPSESPVAWATFATGMNPGRTRIFDFLEKREDTYVPQIALVRQATTELPGTPLRVGFVLLLALGAGIAGSWVLHRMPVNRRVRWGGLAVVTAVPAIAAALVAAWAPAAVPEAIRARQGDAFWKIAGGAGVPTVALQAPMEFPVEESPGARILAGFGVPDVRKSFGLWSLYTTDLLEEESTETGGTRFPLRFEDGVAQSVIRGPRDFTEAVAEVDQPEVEIPVTFRHTAGAVEIEVGETLVSLAAGDWSDFVPVRFPLNPLIRLAGLVRFRVLSLEPNVSVYMEPINFDPERLPPIVDLSHPRDFAGDLARRAGPYETIGWKIITNPLRDEAVDFDAFLEDTRFARESNERLLMETLGEDSWRLLIAVFLFPDRIQHMLYRFADPEHPNHDPELARRYGGGIDETYRDLDRIVGAAMAAAPPETRFLVVSDHGFHSFRKQFNVNTWLAENGYLRAAGDSGERRLEDLFDPEALFFPGVDWSRTSAFALGLSGIYLNQQGREPEGTVAPGAEREQLVERLVADLMAFRDPETGDPVVRAVHRREEIYQGPFVEEAPDLVLGLEPGYRIGWQSTLGGMPPSSVTPNLDNWSGDHCSMEDTAGVLLANLPLREAASLADIAPTVLDLLGISPPEDMDGASLLSR